MSPALRATLGVALVGAAAVAGVGVHRFFATRERGLRIEDPAFHSALHPPAQARAARVIPALVPDLTLADLTGRPRRLSQWRGRPVVINFWATWCEPCRREIPLLKRLRQERQGQNLEIVGIAIDFRDAVAKYAHDHSIEYPLLLGEDEGFAAADAFGMDLLLPFSVFADARGRIVAVKVGELHPDEAKFILDEVLDIDGGRIELPQAREKIAAQLRDLAIERAKRS